MTKIKVGLFRDHRRLPGEFESLAAAHVFAGHHIVFAQHVRAGLREACTISFIGPAGQLSFFGPYQPRDFVFPRLLAMRAIQLGRLFLLSLVEKVFFVHTDFGSLLQDPGSAPLMIIARRAHR